MGCSVFFAPLIVPGLQLREVSGHVRVDSEGLTMLIPLCHTKCLISVGWLSLSLKYYQKWGLSCGKCWFHTYPIFCITGHQAETSKIKAAQNKSESLSVCSDLPSCYQPGKPRMNSCFSWCNQPLIWMESNGSAEEKTCMCSSWTLVYVVKGSLRGALWSPAMGHTAVARWWFACCREGKPLEFWWP